MSIRSGFRARAGSLAVSIDCVSRPIVLTKRIFRMPGQDGVEAPAVCNSPALSELREYALRASHFSFGHAIRCAMVDGLEGAARRAAEGAACEADSWEGRPFIEVRRGFDDV